MGRTRILRSLLFVGILVFGSCGILETREPEAPGQSSSTFVPPTSPNIVLDNLISAIRERNTENYIKCLADSNFSARRFTFVPTQEAQSQYFMVFSSWSTGGERGYFENLKSQTPATATSILLFSNGNFESIQSDSAVYTSNYDLVYQHNVGSVPQEARGTLQFYLATDRNRLWMIYRWVDIKGGSAFTWSDLKGRFSN